MKERILITAIMTNHHNLSLGYLVLSPFYARSIIVNLCVGFHNHVPGAVRPISKFEASETELWKPDLGMRIYSYSSWSDLTLKRAFSKHS